MILMAQFQWAGSIEAMILTAQFPLAGPNETMILLTAHFPRAWSIEA